MLHLVVLGDPVDHSLSPRIHAAALAAAGIEGTYAVRRVGVQGMKGAVAELRAGGLDGANVTMPHKRIAHQLADEVGPDAARAGSVNTLLRRGSKVVGESTDVEGIRRAWGSLPDGPVLLLGAGGAAAAALLALEGRPLTVSARRPEAAQGLLERTGVEGTVLGWAEALPGAVVVNATPIGMSGEVLPSGLLEAATGLFEMPYGMAQTGAVSTALDLGLPVVEGVEMLLQQAALSFEMWTAVSAPISAMRAVLEADHSPESNL
jgi:shikimate dehydrogenase